MNALSTPVPGETLTEAGERIRAACPILGFIATNEECHTRRELITDTLDARGVRPGAHIWHTAQLLNGHVVGVFADSPEEAEIDLTVWWGRRCHWVIPDPHCWVLHEYVPANKRSATAAATPVPARPAAATTGSVRPHPVRSRRDLPRTRDRTMSDEHEGSEPPLLSLSDDNPPDPFRPGEDARPDAAARREELLAKGKRYREAHREERAAARAEWKRNNRERARELNRLSMRRAAQRRKAAAAKAESHRRYYEKHAERLRASSREYLAKRREADPEAYWEWRRASQRAWYQRHKDEVLAKARERAREDPAEKRDYANAYYREHTEQVKARRRAHYQANKDQITARQKEWIEKDKRRKAAGLPKRNLHRTPPAERQANQRAADEFFGGPVDGARLAGLRAELGTPDELLRRFQRDSWRARAVDYAHRNPETRSTVLDRRSSEERRLDEIARVINERLRYREPPRQPHHLDPSTPPPPTWSNPGGGLSR